MQKTNKQRAQSLKQFTPVFFVMGLTYVLQAFALVDVWAWFIVPVGFPPISIAVCVGIMFLFFIASPSSHNVKMPSNEEGNKLIESFEWNYDTVYDLLIFPPLRILLFWGVAYTVQNLL